MTKKKKKPTKKKVSKSTSSTDTDDVEAEVNELEFADEESDPTEYIDTSNIITGKRRRG